MKLLRNPVVVVLLVVAALAVVLNSLWPMLHRVPRSVPQPSATTTPAPAKNAAAAANKPLAEKPAQPRAPTAANVDLSSVQADSPGWKESPKRDPFQMRYEGTNHGFAQAQRHLAPKRQFLSRG